MTARRLKAVPDAAPRFGIAVRVSRVGGRGGERFLSPEIQISAARRRVEQYGGVVDPTVGDDGVFYDLDVSGATDPHARAGLGQALELVQAGQLQGVAIYDLSRFSRDTAGGLRALEQVAAHGGVVLSASETIDMDTPSGEFSTTVQLAANQLRRREASKAWKDTHARRFEMGLPHGKLPYGYVSDGGRAKPDPVLGPAVTKAFVEYAAGGVSQKELAARLGQLRGRPMRQGVISQLLRNRFYAGEVEFLGEVRPGVHTPLVDRVTWERVQRRLSYERQAGPHWRTPGSPVIGLVFCASCHGPLYRSGVGNRGGRPRAARMICAGVTARTCEGIGTPLLEQVEEAVKDLALAVARRKRDRAPAQVERDSKAARAAAQLVRLRAEEREQLDELGRLTADKARKVISERAYAAAAAPMEEALDRLAAQILELEVAEQQASVPVEELASAAARIAQLWPEMTPGEARAALRLLLPRVEIRRASYRGEDISARLILPDD